MSFDPKAAAREIAAAHAARKRFENLAGPLIPPSIDDAYAAQEALVDLWAPKYGPVAGLKIATTTKVMQELMGIDHPCGGMIYRDRIHPSPARVSKASLMHLVVECELAVRIGRDLPDTGTPYTRQQVAAAASGVMAAFELIEDRNAVYKETKATTLIADNAWNGGIVIGREVAPPSGDWDGLEGTLRTDGAADRTGRTDDPLGALAWIANLAVKRRRPLRAGMVVITGSVIPTLPIEIGQTFTFEIERVGTVAMTAV
jgi:2-keto-4-pentenoate hydratase